MKKYFALLHLTLLLLFVLPAFSNDGLNPHHLSMIKNVSEVVVSDDGKNVAYLVSSPIPYEDNYGFLYQELYLYNVKKAEITPLVTGKVTITSISWVPGKEAVSYRQNTENTTGWQVFSIDIKDKTIEQLTDFSQSINRYAFRNAEELIFSSQAPHSSEKQHLLSNRIDVKVFEEELRDIDLYRYDLENNEAVKLTENVTVYDFSVSPDGSKIAAAISEKNLIDYYYMFQRIHILDAETGNVIRTMNNPGKLGNMSWSPNSRRLAFRSASKLEDSVVGSIFIMDAEDEDEKFEDLRNYVEGMEISVIDVFWGDNNTLLYISEASVDITLTSLDLKKDKREYLIEGGKAVFRAVSKHKNDIYFSGNTWEHPGELMHYNIRRSRLSKLTSYNDEWLSEVRLGKQEKITWYARDGKDIDGVLIYPLDYEEGNSYPLIVYIHGGPEACVKNGWNNHYSQWGQFAASRGYFVFSPNYRASSGRGVEFTMAGYGDLLGTEYDDVLDGIDHLINEGMVDKDRVGIGGGSYGGFFAAYSATKHTDRFAASVVFVGIANQVSKRKTTDIPYEDYYVHWGFWTHEDHEKVWNASPVQYVKGSRTPTLILHGEEDTRIPVTQGLELYRGLKLHGEAPVRFVLYPGEGHGNRKNINRYDYLVRTLEWFDFYLIDNPGSKDMPNTYIDYPID